MSHFPPSSALLPSVDFSTPRPRDFPSFPGLRNRAKEVSSIAGQSFSHYCGVFVARSSVTDGLI